ncbi:MAG: dethiobiotin synthase, partial [Alphaproteobacteria bacterium]|nr:dethiobiotin synthase [Alphaproteobacteria bacterium]
MAKKLFVSGTGTDVGKTFVSGLILKKLNDHGINCGYYKAAVSGNVRGNDGSLIPGDALYVKTVSGIGQPLEAMCPFVYENAVSPHLASRIEGEPVRLDIVLEKLKAAEEQYDYL